MKDRRRGDEPLGFDVGQAVTLGLDQFAAPDNRQGQPGNADAGHFLQDDLVRGVGLLSTVFMRLGKELPIQPRFVAAIVEQPVLDPRKIRRANPDGLPKETATGLQFDRRDSQPCKRPIVAIDRGFVHGLASFHA